MGRRRPLYFSFFRQQNIFGQQWTSSAKKRSRTANSSAFSPSHRILSLSFIIFSETIDHLPKILVILGLFFSLGDPFGFFIINKVQQARFNSKWNYVNREGYTLEALLHLKAIANVK